MTRLVILSDTHGFYSKIDIPEGDILIHAGDITTNGTIDETIEFNRFLETLPHTHKIVIAGNHDTDLEKYPQLIDKALSNCTFLLDQTVGINGIKFYGTPWHTMAHHGTPWHTMAHHGNQSSIIGLLIYRAVFLSRNDGI